MAWWDWDSRIKVLKKPLGTDMSWSIVGLVHQQINGTRYQNTAILEWYQQIFIIVNWCNLVHWLHFILRHWPLFCWGRNLGYKINNLNGSSYHLCPWAAITTSRPGHMEFDRRPKPTATPKMCQQRIWDNNYDCMFYSLV